MENQPVQNTHIPPNCFRQEEVEAFQSFENQCLTGINYYLWLSLTESTPTVRFLFALELIFDSETSLLISAGEDSEAIRVIPASALLETATRLKQLHGQPIIQRLARDGQSIWADVVGKKLDGIQLARHENGLYLNDAMVLHFDSTHIVVELPEAGEGLELRMV